MPDKRVDALNSLNKNDYNSKYVTLSDNTKIGVDLITDLIKYFELEFKNKYRYDYLKWTKIQVDNPSNEIYEYKPSTPKVCDPANATAPAPAVPPTPGAGGVNTTTTSSSSSSSSPSSSPRATTPTPAAPTVPAVPTAVSATATASGENSAKYKIIFGDDEYREKDDDKAIQNLRKLLQKHRRDGDDLIDLSNEEAEKAAAVAAEKAAVAAKKAAAAEAAKKAKAAKKTAAEATAETEAEAAKIALEEAENALEEAKNALEEAKNALEEAKKEKLRKNYRDSSINLGYIPIIEISCTNESSVYFRPSLVDNYTDYDFQEKSQIYDDLNKLNSIFKKNNYADLDDLVILDFYKDFTKKVEKLKGDIISRDDDVKYDLIDNIYDKLAIIYEIKIGRNKKIVKKPIKEVIALKPDQKYTPKDICKISKDDTNNLFNEILCEINKRAQIFNNLKKGGKQAKRGGAPRIIMTEQSKDTLGKLFEAINQNLQDRKQTFEDIDKNILNKLMNDDNIVNKPTEKSIKNSDNVSGKIQFNAFNRFIEEIKNMTVKESDRYLNIIKSLNLIKSKALGTLPSPSSSQGGKKGGAYQKGNAGNVNMNQGDKRIQKQANEENKNTGNPGKEYLKNLKDIYINLAKEYGKFIKDENKLKETIKKVIKSQEDIEKDNVSDSSDNEAKKKELTDKKKEDIENNFKLREKELNNIEQKIKKVESIFNELNKKGNKSSAPYYTEKQEIDTLYGSYKKLYADFKGIKDDLIKHLFNNDKETTELKTDDKEVKKKEKALKKKEKALKTNDEALKATDETLKAKEEDINKLIDKYRLIYNNNASELANEETKKELEELENQNKENEKKSKNLEERKKQLTASLKVIKEELRKLYKACIDINLPYATEYNDFVKNIIKVGQLKYIIDDNPQINNNNEIIDAYNKEIDRIDKELGDIKIDITSNAKKINDKKEITKSQGQGRNNRPSGGALYGGGTKEDEEKEKENLVKLLNGNLLELIKEGGDNNLYEFIKELKSVFDNDDDNEVGQDNASGKKYNEKETLYEQIWKDYSDGVKAYYSNQKGKNPLTYINEGEKLKNKVILYDLDPEIVLKITFQDKVVFLALMFAIRTMIMVLFEFLIDYNIVKSLRYAILIYAVFYILILLLFTAFVNLDSYKLRIVFNYLNMHINTPGIILHIMLFIIFSLLVIIIIQTDNFINNLGDILDYTYIYNYIYTFNFDNILSGEFENNLTKDEKIKLQYRLDIISMLIFIFSGTLILLM